MNIPYSNANPQGPNSGFDCSGLVLYVFQNDPHNTLKLPRTVAAQKPAFEKSGEFMTRYAKRQAQLSIRSGG